MAEIEDELKTFKYGIKTIRSCLQKIKAEEIVSVWIAYPKMTTRPGPEYRSKSETYLIRQIALGVEPEIKSAHGVGARRSLVLRLFQN